MIIEAEPKFVNEFDSKKYVYGVCQCPMDINHYAIVLPKTIGKEIYVYKCRYCGAKGTIYDALVRNYTPRYTRKYLNHTIEKETI